MSVNKLNLENSDLFQDLSSKDAEIICGGVAVEAAGLLSRGVNRISVDLRDFVDAEFRNQNRLENDCSADLDSGTLSITCNISDYVIGGADSPDDISLDPEEGPTVFSL